MILKCAVVVLSFILWMPAAIVAQTNEGGRRVYTARCASCHGPAGEGEAAIAASFRVEIPHLGSEEVQSMTDEQIMRLLTEGGKRAKPVRNLSQADAAAVIIYVRTLKLED